MRDLKAKDIFCFGLAVDFFAALSLPLYDILAGPANVGFSFPAKAKISPSRLPQPLQLRMYGIPSQIELI
jgi:hypothetical protein